MSETRTGTLAGLRTVAPRPGRARWGLALLVATALGCIAACAGPPSSGPYRTAVLNHDQNQIRITPKKPYPGIQPQKLVQAFLAATAGDDGDPTFGVAQQYFADNLGPEWAAQPAIKDGEATILAKLPTPDDPIFDPPAAATSSPEAANALGQTAIVNVTVTPMASLRRGGFYALQEAQQQVHVQFHLAKVKVDTSKDLQWRITEKPDKRLISIDDLRRAYKALPVFQPYNSAANTNTATVGQIYVVPSDTRRTYQALAEALLRGPGDDSADPGVTVTPDLSNGTVTVELAKIPKLANGQPKWDATTLLAALAQTFQAAAPSLQLGGGATTFTKLILKESGAPDTWRPLSATSTGADYPAIYYASGGSVFRAGGSSPGPTSTTPPAVLDVAATGRTFGKIAVRREQPGGDDAGRPSGGATVSVAAVVTKGAGLGDIVVYDKLDPVKTTTGALPATWYHPPKAQLITDLTWDPIDGSLWVVDDGHLYNVQAPEGEHPSQPTEVGLIGSDPYQRIRLSPDGRQAVVVTGSHVDDPSSDATTTALLAHISRPDLRADPRTDTSGPAQLTLDRRYAIQPTIATPGAGKLHIADVSWADGRTIVLLAKEPGGAPPKLYKVYADGSQDDRLLDVEQAEGQATTRMAAVVPEPGSTQLRIFSNGQKADNSNQQGIYWKGKTFDFLSVGDNPVAATAMVAGP